MRSACAIFLISTLILFTGATACAPGGETDRGDAPLTLEAAIGPFVVDPGVENTQCVIVRLKNPDAVFIRGIHAELSRSSHHMTIYTSTEIDERPDPFDCLPFVNVLQGGRPIFIAQQHQSGIVFPADESGVPVGYAIRPRQMVQIEMHYMNVAVKPAAVEARIFLDTVPISTKVTEADIAFWGTTDIHIPPNSAWETPVKFVSAAPGTRAFAMTTHQHQLGTRMRVWHADDAGDTTGEPVADGRNWLDPPLEIYNPPLLFGPGGKTGLAYRCEWKNPTAKHVGFGQSVNDEMCIVWHYYFPSRGFSYVRQP